MSKQLKDLSFSVAHLIVENGGEIVECQNSATGEVARAYSYFGVMMDLDSGDPLDAEWIVQGPQRVSRRSVFFIGCVVGAIAVQLIRWAFQ